MTASTNINRRTLLTAVPAGAAVLASSTVLFDRGAAAQAQSTFGPLKRISAGVLDVAYAEAGPASGTPVILLHGWPYDIHTYVDVAPRLAAAGYRAIVPYLRGYGATRFHSADTPRNGRPHWHSMRSI